jgi:hypothetical protein
MLARVHAGALSLSLPSLYPHASIHHCSKSIVEFAVDPVFSVWMQTAEQHPSHSSIHPLWSVQSSRKMRKKNPNNSTVRSPRHTWTVSGPLYCELEAMMGAGRGVPQVWGA